MPVINDILLSICELFHTSVSVPLRLADPGVRIAAITHILPDDRSKTRQPQQPHTRDLINPQPLTRKERLADTLSLELLHHALGTSQEPVVAHGPALVPAQSDGRDVAEHVRRKQQLPRPGEGAGGQFPAGHEFLEPELDGALEGDGGRHGDHGARFRGERTPRRQLDGQNGVGVPVRDAVRAAVEGADVVDARGGGADEMSWRRGAGGEVGGIGGVEGRGVFRVGWVGAGVWRGGLSIGWGRGEVCLLGTVVRKLGDGGRGPGVDWDVQLLLL